MPPFPILLIQCQLIPHPTAHVLCLLQASLYLRSHQKSQRHDSTILHRLNIFHQHHMQSTSYVICREEIPTFACTHQRYAYFMSWFRLPWAEAGSEFHSYGYFYLGFLHVSFQIIVNPRNKMSIKTSQSKKSWCCSWSSKRINVPRKLRPDPKSFIQKPMAFCKAKFVYVRNTFTSSFYKFNRHR